MSVLRLALATPLRRLFDYLPPNGVDPALLRPGVRLRVPFGRRSMVGILMEVAEDSELPREQLKAADALLDVEALPNPALLKLCRWASDYYLHPVGEVMANAFPPTLRKGAELPAAGQPGWELTAQGRGLPESALPRAPRQAQALALLGDQQAHTEIELKAAGISRDIMRKLAARGWAAACTVEAARLEPRARPGLPLNDEQAAAVSAIGESLGRFSAHLLEGVTGSGKTEVYLSMIADCLARGQQALVLIPEIGLTPQTLARFEQRFDAGICAFHSGMTDAQRLASWAQARSGAAQIVIGTRSAIFTAMPRLGLIVVDEEHDASFKQQDGFRYSARDIAVKRAQLEACPIVLGSATPALESLHNVDQGRYEHHLLKRRAGDAKPPIMEVLDIRHKPLTGGLSEALLEAVGDTLERGEQVLLFLNRRGYAPSLLCHDCGWVADCHSCDARMTVHRRRGQLRCHHCGASARLPTQCPSCHSHALLTRGLGTEQAEEELIRRFGRWPVHRVDSDSTRGRDAMGKLIEQVGTGEPCLLLGTQMLAKGHHFPEVTLVGIIDADAMLFSGDFRGEERMAQLLTQVAGRAGRAQRPGRVLVQSHHPDHPALRALIEQGYSAQARELLASRRARCLPPAGQLALIRSDCSHADTGEGMLLALRQHLSAQAPPGVTLVGPLPAPMQRRAGKFRSHLLIQGARRRDVRAAAARAVMLAEQLKTPGDCKWSIDIDPTEPL